MPMRIRSRRTRSSSGRCTRTRRRRTASGRRCAGAPSTCRLTRRELLSLECLDHVVGDVDRPADEQRVLEDQVELVILRVAREHLVEMQLQLVQLLELARAKVLGELLAQPL